MSATATPFVLGYHGCDRSVGMQIVCGQEPIKSEDRPYHWLGRGIYFWENDYDRALEWATEKQKPDEIKDPFVIGGVIDLGQCLDLYVRENIALVRSAYDQLEAEHTRTNVPMPKNKKAPKDPRRDNVLRYLDCAVINNLHALNPGREWDTVRGLFVEGEPIYPNAELYHKTHSEIAVCNPKCIVGLFLPRNVT